MLTERRGAPRFFLRASRDLAPRFKDNSADHARDFFVSSDMCSRLVSSRSSGVFLFSASFATLQVPRQVAIYTTFVSRGSLNEVKNEKV